VVKMRITFVSFRAEALEISLAVLQGIIQVDRRLNGGIFD